MKNKKILLICKESFSFPMFFVAKKLLNDGNCVGVFFVHPEESVYKRSLYNKDTYYNFKDNIAPISLYDMKDFCKAFDQKLNSNDVDDKFLDEIEKNYTHFKNLNLQLTSSQITTRHNHSRFFFNLSNNIQNKLILELAYKKVFDVLDDFKPDVIYDIEDGELLRTVLNEVAFKRNIPYINVDYPRFEEYKIPTFCLGNKLENYLSREYDNFYKKGLNGNKKSVEYVINYRNRKTIMSLEFVGTTTSQYKPESLLKTFKGLFNVSIYFVLVFLISRNILVRKKNQILYSNPLKHFLFYCKTALKRQYLYRSNNFFDSVSSNESYVYMPLHVIPESTTFVKAPFYINELMLIEQVSKSLPIGWFLYVKEHQAMLGERDLSFYRAVKKIPNVKLINFKHYSDPKPWIENSQGVVAVSGTGAYEAAMLGKKSIVFADVPFTLIEGVHRVNSFDELPKIISSFSKIDNLNSCAAYISAVASQGSKLNLKYLITESEKIIQRKKDVDLDFQNHLNTLLDFFDHAYNLYLNENTVKI